MSIFLSPITTSKHLIAQLQRLFSSAGLVLFQITLGTTPNIAPPSSLKYPVSIGGDNGKLYSALRELNPNGSIPFMVLLNKKGEYVTHYVGMVPEEMLQGDIDKLIGK